MIDERVRIKCPKCAGTFRERAQRVKPGYECECKICEKLLIFDASSENQDIRRALKSARQIRNLLEEPKPETPSRFRLARGQADGRR